MFSKVGRMVVNHSVIAVFGIIIFSIFTVSQLNAPVFAETVAKSTSFEKTTLIEYTNNEGVEIKTVRMWFGKDAGTFKSFKTEKGWTGTKNSQGVLIFTTLDPLAPGESVKFGIKTENQNPGVNWKTIDTSGNELTTGRTEVGQEPPPPPDDATPSQPPEDITPETVTNFDKATFRIIPESPKNGDSIRVVGDGFPPNTPLDFLIDNEKLEDFSSDNSGHVVGRAKVPVNKEADRVEFSLVDDKGNKKTISIRIAHKDTQIISTRAKQLTITQITEIAEPGKKITASGTAEPGSTVAITARDATGAKIYEAAVPVDSQGNWSHEATVSPDTELGTRTLEFTDGPETITRLISISVSKAIHITSSAIKYDPGQKMLFNGTAAADQAVEILIKDPIGKEIYSDILKMNGTTAINFEFPTTQASLQGTYVILMTQGDDTEILRIGLGELPSQQIVAKFDKLNYSASEKAKLTVEGPPNEKVSILIIDPSDKVKITDSVTLGADGSADYELDLNGYKSGVYSVVLKQLKSQVETVFSVGLQHGSGAITIQSTKQTYQLGDGILVLGSTSKNVLLTLELSSPDGTVIKHKEIFTDKEGKFSDGTFRIPSDAKQGTWVIKATSGPNYAEAKLNVVGTITQGFIVSVDKSTAYRVGDTMKITGTGAGKTQTAIITLYDSKDVKIQELIVTTTETGSFQTIWIVPVGTLEGDYKIKAKVSNEIAETTFKIQ